MTRRRRVSWRCTISSSNVSEAPEPDAGPLASVRDGVEPRRWTLHGLNNGLILRATCAGVGWLPTAASYAIGDAGTWLAHRLMPATRAALVDNLQKVDLGASPGGRARLARRTLRAYARDTIDLLRAQSLDPAAAAALFDLRPEHQRAYEEVLALGRGAILVTGHYGNWEIGSIILTRVLQLPLAAVAMPEASAEVNRIRRDIRTRLGVDTIEVRQSLDTALQIRRRLTDNHVVAMLMDRHLGRDRVRVSFLGRKAWFLRTPALMGYLTGAPLMPSFVERTDRRPAFGVHVGQPIVVSRTLPRDVAIQRAAQAFADELSARVRQHPEYWYQFYRYWDAQDDSYEGLI